LKKFFASIGFLAALATTPALAHPSIKYIINQTFAWAPILEITEVILTIPGGGSNSFFVGNVGPGQWAAFNFFKDPPCLRWVTLINEYKPPVTAPTQFNVCTQTKITVTQNSAAGYVFAYN
jgi:hypothetical protein